MIKVAKKMSPNAAVALRAAILQTYPALEGNVQMFKPVGLNIFGVKAVGQYEIPAELANEIEVMIREFVPPAGCEDVVAERVPAWYLATRKKYARRG